MLRKAKCHVVTVDSSSHLRSFRVNASSSSPLCEFCNNANHVLRSCPFSSKISSLVWQRFLRRERLCFKCFDNHLASNCPADGFCKIANCKCGCKHSHLLHELFQKGVRTPVAMKSRRLSIAELPGKWIWTLYPSLNQSTT